MLAVRLYPKNLFHPKLPSPQPEALLASLPKPPNETPPPTRITIPSLSLSLPVAPANIADNRWTLYEDKVSWLVTSKTPGGGNVILFAHNREELFGDLKNLRLGERITVESAGQKYSYLVKEKRKVTPSDVEAVLSEENRLTLYTCEGSFDQKRLIVIASLEKG